jgi:hypothetical protein
MAGVGIAAAPASASAAAGSDWIVYATSSSLAADTPATLIQGARGTDGACKLTGSGELKPGQAAVQTDELAFNPKTCQSKMVIRTLTANELAAAQAKEAGSSDSIAPLAAKPVGDKASGGIGAMAYQSGWSRTWYEDPVSLTVNAVKNWTGWNYNGSCVTSASGSWEHNWYSPSGWSRISHNFNNVYSCYQSESSSYVHYRNGTFCASVDTHTYYDRNWVYGRYNGTLAWQWNVTKSGGCTNLLSFHQRAAYGS